MAHTYSSLFFHLVWSTKKRLPLINPLLQKRLYDYIGGVIRKQNGDLIQIGGMSDHIHIFLKIPTHCSIADFVRNIKSNSSLFINKNFSLNKFEWQEGYGAFSVSFSKQDIVKKYIANQEKHHKNDSFDSEFVKLFEKHEIDYEKKYLFN